MSVTEAAATLGVTRQRVLQMIHEGTVNGFRVGNGWALSHAEIDNLAAKKYAINSSH
ncbi:excisionase family DNA-binding protein [uncultured Bifidobacterium sp.]|uniref:excisionase family DNA-binding protein n=1 Tax=uncultured Bifidobacterium sp. TaxID=165187 RepID=UPI00258CEAE8|nr:excisionase family DNA-binding protein [uncultured Bifidobacterium sp.]